MVLFAYSRATKGDAISSRKACNHERMVILSLMSKVNKYFANFYYYAYRKDSSNSTTQINSTQQFFVTVLLSNRDSFKLDTQILTLL